MTSRRGASGLAAGALAGEYPTVGLGLVPFAGVSIVDDFFDPGVSNRYGVLFWQATALGGDPAAINYVVPTEWTVAGQLRLTTTTTTNSGSVLALGTAASIHRVPPPGSIWACKVSVSSGTTAYELWSGFAESEARVGVADTVDFVGVRSTGGNLFGVVKNGASESTVDLGVDCEGSTWRTVGFEVGGTTADPSVQFFILDLSDDHIVERTDVGDPVTTTLPNMSLMPIAIGLVTTTAGSRAAQIDAWALGGRSAR